MNSNARVRMLGLGGIALVLFGMSPCPAAPPSPPERTLERLGLGTTSAEVLNYLAQSLPGDWRTKEHGGDEPRCDHRSQDYRVYEVLLDYCQEFQVVEAKPFLLACIEAPLPEHISKALWFKTLKDYHPEVPEGWKQQTLQSEAWFRVKCAEVLAAVDSREAVPTLLKLLREWQMDLKQYMQTEKSARPHFQSWPFSQLCLSLSKLGSKEPVAACIELVPFITPREPEFLIDPLQRMTGQHFGPHWGLPESRHETEKARWLSWWAANKEQFKFPGVASYTSEEEHARWVLRWTLGPGVQGSSEVYNAVEEEWLADYVNAHPQWVQHVATDENENYLTRRNALKWHERLAGAKSLRLLRAFALEAPGPEAADRDLQYELISTAYRILCEKYPDVAAVVARQCLLGDSPLPKSWLFSALEKQNPSEALRLAKKHLGNEALAGTAMDVLLRHSGDKPLEEIEVEQLVAPARHRLVEWCLEQKEIPPIFVLEDALASSNTTVPTSAIRIIDEQQLEPKLSPEARQRLVHHLEDPKFLLLSWYQLRAARQFSAAQGVLSAPPDDSARLLPLLERIHEWAANELADPKYPNLGEGNSHTLEQIHEQAWALLNERMASGPQ